MAPSLVVAALAIGVGLWAIRATATGNCLDDFDLFAGTGVLDNMSDKDDALVAGVGALVLVVVVVIVVVVVVILIFGGWVRGCARLLCAAHGASTS